MKDFINISQRDKAVLMGLFISKFNQKALESFGFTTLKEAYNVFGYSVKIRPTSIKLYQQEFDPYFPNGRKGWHKRELREYCREIMDRVNDLSFNDFRILINSFVLDEYVDINDIYSHKSQSRERKFSASRQLTGKAAEEYFVMNYQNIVPFQNYLLKDTTNMGCGFDYKLSLESNNYYVEVKGINERQGSILMTEKEYNMAEDLLERYCLFVVSNFKEKPFHQMFFNPVHSDRLLFQRQEQQVRQVNYQTNILYSNEI